MEVLADSIDACPFWVSFSSSSLFSDPPSPSLVASGLKDIPEREVCCYSISCKSSVNIDITLDWLKKHRKTGGGGGGAK